MLENDKSPQKPNATPKWRKRPRHPTGRTILRILRSVIAFDAMGIEGHRPVVLLFDGRGISNLSQLVDACARRSGYSSRHIWRWRTAFYRGGLPALTNPPRRDKGFSHSFSGRSVAIALIFVRHFEGRSLRAIHEELAAKWPRWYLGSPPSYPSLRWFVRTLLPAAPRSAARQANAVAGKPRHAAAMTSPDAGQ